MTVWRRRCSCSSVRPSSYMSCWAWRCSDGTEQTTTQLQAVVKVSRFPSVHRPFAPNSTPASSKWINGGYVDFKISRAKTFTWLALKFDSGRRLAPHLTGNTHSRTLPLQRFEVGSPAVASLSNQWLQAIRPSNYSLWSSDASLEEMEKNKHLWFGSTSLPLVNTTVMKHTWKRNGAHVHARSTSWFGLMALTQDPTQSDPVKYANLYGNHMTQWPASKSGSHTLEL
jgi:hypothetical protein